MRIGIRVDASTEIGLGHVKRCASLAHALRMAGAEVVFISKKTDVDVAPYLPEGDRLHLMESVANDADATIAVLSQDRVDWVIVDHYQLDATWHCSVAESLAARVAVIDDLANRPISADVLIDHNLTERPEEKYQAQLTRPARQLLGPAYALLGPAYLSEPPHEMQSAVRSIGIFLGGTDPSSMSAVVLRACRELAAFDGEIEVVSTSSNPHLPALKEEVARWTKTRLTLDLDNLAAFFSRHSLQIGAGGGATWERARMGAPTIALICADNQKVVVPQMAEFGAVFWPGSNEPETIAQAVQELTRSEAQRLKLSQRARTLVDGRGTQRVALTLLASMLQVRRARVEDAQMLHDWRNDERTRAVSHDSRLIPFDDHCRWLRSVIADPSRALWVGMVGDFPVGAIRFDRANDDLTVSLYLDPALHGLRLGIRLLLSGEQAARTHFRGLLRVFASVLADNEASHKLFKSAGYAEHSGVYVKTLPPSQMDSIERSVSGST